MWAMMLTRPLTFEKVEVPTPREEDLLPGQVILRLQAGGLCGSDAPYYRGVPYSWGQTPDPVPGFPMHEVVGEVVASKQTDLAVGTSVVGWASAFNGLAEYVVTEADGLSPYDPALTPSQAITLQPLACVSFAVERIGDVSGEHCAVIGLGPIGLLFSHVLRSAGASEVTGVDRLDRSDVSNDFGVDNLLVTSSGMWAEKIVDDRRPNVVVEAVGHQVSTLNHAINAIKDNGRIYCFGVPDDQVYPIEMELFFRKHLTLKGGPTPDRRRLLELANAYAVKNRVVIDSLLTHQFTVDEVSAAYDTAFTARPGQLKVVINV